jgi:hypothetical protein
MDLDDCPCSYRLTADGEEGAGAVRNLSGSGMLLVVGQEFPPGTLMTVKVSPHQALVPPLTASVEVLRATGLAGGLYETAVVIKSMG